ncbi:unnamed protein product [Dicrocoelium dendriticum]|nr:unnamed protein product [Dicrocoelium dendriticum]
MVLLTLHYTACGQLLQEKAYQFMSTYGPQPLAGGFGKTYDVFVFAIELLRNQQVIFPMKMRRTQGLEIKSCF